MKPTLVRALVLLLSFSSMVGELLLSQLTNSFVGGTFLTYTLAIGAYLTSMGLSSLLYVRIRDRWNMHLEKVEHMTITTALVSPLIIGASHTLNPSITLWVCLFMTALLGFLTGLEIPLFVDLFSQTHGEDKHHEALALEFDYYGSFLGAIAFPLMFLPYFDSIQIVLIATIANGLSLVTLYALTKKVQQRAFLAFNIIAYFSFFAFRIEILRFLESAYGNIL